MAGKKPARKTTREKIVAVRFSVSEHESLLKIAEEEDRSLSNLIRKMVLKKSERQAA